MLAVVMVGVALQRPPRTDAFVRVVVEAENETQAMLTACLMASADKRVVMPTESEVIDILEI
jgi:hypothetical protein